MDEPGWTVVPKERIRGTTLLDYRGGPLVYCFKKLVCWLDYPSTLCEYK